MTKQFKEIEIPLGAKDSELCGWEYTIPEGMEATIVDNKIIVKKKESEDERIRKELMQNLKERFGTHGSMGRNLDMPRVLAWFEKQKPAEWSEEDLYKIENALFGTYAVDSATRLLNKIKSLRPQNWTKEDKERYISCLQRLGTGNPEQPETINSKWFKEHVYPQSHWKPSDEQMEALLYEVNAWDEDSINGQILKSLYQDLKKLKEE